MSYGSSFSNTVMFMSCYLAQHIVNANGELVGLVFDGNIESLAGDFVYDGTKNRTVAVHSAGMLEALRHIYHADKLADEIEGK